MRLHVGCGDKYWPGFTNIDKYSSRADGQSDCMALDYADGTASEIHAIHLLEHFPRLSADKALQEWYRVLKAGGLLVLELPSLDKMVRLITAGEENIRLTLMGLYGDPWETKPGMEHKWAWSMKEIEQALDQAGFADVSCMEPKFHIPERDFRVEARKPS